MCAKFSIEAEMERLQQMAVFEHELQNAGFHAIAGIDEVGRGPLAGPVVSAAVILPEDYYPIGINDSKKVSEKKREALFEDILKHATAYGFGIIDKDEIDRINILNATKASMKMAVTALKTAPDYLLIDAVKLEDISIPQKNIVKGDSLSISIAAASIIAKVTRDRMMCDYDSRYPEYGFAKHKGYGTKQHIDAIKKYGISPIHRLTYVKNFI